MVSLEVELKRKKHYTVLVIQDISCAAMTQYGPSCSGSDCAPPYSSLEGQKCANDGDTSLCCQFNEDEGICMTYEEINMQDGVRYLFLHPCYPPGNKKTSSIVFFMYHLFFWN